MGDVTIQDENPHEERKSRKRKLSKKSENEVELLPAHTNVTEEEAENSIVAVKEETEKMEEGFMKKRKLNSEEKSNEADNDIKKPQKFSAKEFRQKLQTKSAHEAIKQFVQFCTDDNNSKKDYALEYLASGGNTSELIRVIDGLENKNASFVHPLIEAYSIILLKIISTQPQKQLHAEESCRELLNKHYSILKSMLSLSSNSKQRKVALKLLSIMVTLNPSIAKEVLGLTIFEPAVLEILTQPSNLEDGSSVRTFFVHYLISFLISGHTPTILTFLEKRILLNSIFSGLIYDTPDLIDIVLSTIKTNILEEISISKTVKMAVFNTQVVRNIVNLYNWKGPKNWKPNMYKKSTTVVVNQVVREHVSEIAHNFLLILCASKNGIIFNDPSIGLSAKKCNPLILTVLQSLDKPWNNKFSSELVIKICTACPDVAKTVIQSVETYLEPRPSQNWLNTVRFTKSLIEHLDPKCVQQFLGQLNIKQISIIIQSFCAPFPILKALSTAMIKHEHIGIRHESISLLFSMLDGLDKYLNFVKSLTVFTAENKITLKGLMTDYLNKNLPPAAVILQDWNQSILPVTDVLDPSIPAPEINLHLNKLLDILFKYNSICPQLVDHVTKEIQTNEFLKTIEEFNVQQTSETIEMHIKAINLLLSCDSSLFVPSKDLFSYALPLLLKYYVSTTDILHLTIENILMQFFQISGIFEGCKEEINIWLYSFLELEHYDQNLGEFATNVFKKTSKHFIKYVTELTSLKENSESANNNVSNLYAMLSQDSSLIKTSNFTIKHRILSPLILGFLERLLETANNNEVGIITQYLNVVLIHLLHLQSTPQLVTKVLLQEKYNNVNKHVIKYFKSWDKCSNILFKKIYNSDSIFYKLNKYLLEEESGNFAILKSITWKKYYNVLIINNIMFYYTQFLSQQLLTESLQDKTLEIIKYILNNMDENQNEFFYCLNSVLKHPLILNHFSALSNDKISNLSTDFLTIIIQYLLTSKTKLNLEPYLCSYRIKLVESIQNMLHKYKKKNSKVQNINNKILDLVNLLNLSFEQRSDIVEIVAELSSQCFITEENKPSIVAHLIKYCLSGDDKNPQYLKPFSNIAITAIGTHLYELNSSKTENFDCEYLEISLSNYVAVFPHLNSCFDEKLFNCLISKSVVNKSSIKLASILLKSNNKLFDTFVKQLDTLFKNIEKRELVFALIDCIMNKTDLKGLDGVLQKTYKEYESVVLKFINKPQKASNYLIEYSSVVNKFAITADCMKTETCKEICSKALKFDVTEYYHSEVLNNLYNRSILSAENDEMKNKFVSNYITTMMNLLVNVFKKYDKNENNFLKIDKIAQQFLTHIIKIKNVYKINYNDDGMYKSTVFQTFTKLCLKLGLKEKYILINILKQLSSLKDGENSELGIIFEMAISHSESLNVLLSDDPRKAPLLSLLLTLAKKCPTVINKSHIPIWLGAYEATLSQCDQYILELLSLYESANVGFHEYRPYLWGKAAVGHYSVRFGVQNKLWRQPKPMEVLDLFNENKIMKTVKYFPLSRNLSGNKSLYSDSEIDVYDSSFYLPLLSHLLAPESTIRWYQCIQRGILSLPIIALTSESKEVRSAACYVLARFHAHLEAATYGKPRLLWLHLIETICRGISVLESLRPPTIVALFLARCAIIFTLPDHLLYTSLGNYIMAKECPNFHIVPELLSMLHSTDVNNNAHRNFILEVIRDGLRTNEDLQLLYRSVAFKLLMDLYNSVLLDNQGRKLILEIISSTVAIPNGARTLVSGYSLISWLHTVFKRFRSSDTNLLIIFIDILNNLVSSYDENHFKQIQFNVLLILVSLIDTLRLIRPPLSNLVCYIKVLYKMYCYRPCLITKNHLINLLNVSSKLVNCNTCNYYLEYGADFAQEPILNVDNDENQACYYLKLLTLKWITTNKLFVN